MEITITRRSKVGYGYNSAAEQVWNQSQTESWLRPAATTSPTHTGTIKQVCKAIQEDRTLESFRGGTQYTTAWFVKVGKEWRRMKHTIDNDCALYILTSPNYYIDEVDVEIEE